MSKHVSTLTQTVAFLYRSANVTANDDVLTDVITETEPGNLIPTRGPESGIKFRGIEIYPFGTDAEDKAFSCQLQQVNRIARWGKSGVKRADFTQNLDVQWMVRNITTLTCTLGATADGTAGGFVTDSDFTADTITQVRTTFGVALEDAFEASVPYSPAGDTIGASYYLPDFGNTEYLRLAFDSIEADTAASANALICLYA